MLLILIALVAGFFIGCLLDRLVSSIVNFIHEKEKGTEIGAISCAPARQTFFAREFPLKGISALLAGYIHPIFKNGRNLEFLTVKTSLLVLISSVFSGIVAWHFGATLNGMAALLCLYFLISLGFIDSGTGYLPDCLTYPFLWAGLLVNIKAAFVPLHIAVISALSAYLICRTANAVFRFVTGNDGMGYGDFKMIAALGAWFGWICLVFIVIMASLLAIVIGLVGILSGRTRFEKFFPFGPYLSIATLPILLYGRILMQTLNDFS